MFGIGIRIHLLFPLVALGLIFRPVFMKEADPRIWVDSAMVMGLLFFSVLLHEFGHCFFARWVGGEANEVLLWPLGGLAQVDVPHTPRANFITTAGGPLANLFLCALTALTMAFTLSQPFRPSLNPFWAPFYIDAPGMIELTTWQGVTTFTSHWPTVVLARFFYVNWLLFLFNMVLVGYPMDAGRLLQCTLWPHFGYRQATLYAVYAGFFTMFVLICISFVVVDPLLLVLAFFIYVSCQQQWLLLETGGEDSLFGYDFSQGYTSLERDQPAPRRKQPNFFQRWLQRRAAKKRQRLEQQQQEEESRMDQLLEKIQRFGKESLTEEEHRFLKRVADRYRNK